MSSTESIVQRISFLTSRREQLLNSLREVEDELAVQRAWLARRDNDQLPVSTLPHHLLTDILLQLHLQELSLKKVPATHKPGIEFVASQVSFRWREAVLSTPLLWRTIRMQVKPPRQTTSFNHINARLARSHPCPLDIFLDLQVYNDALESQIYQSLATHSDRWRKLSLITEIRNESQVDLGPIVSVSNATNLELFSFSARSVTGLSSLHPRQGLAMTFGSEKLTTVRLGGKITRHISLPFTHVTTLHLAGCPISLLLDAPPTLLHLSLTDMLGLGQLMDPVVLPNLLSLRIISNFTANVINWLTMPRLLSLTLDQLPNFDWGLERVLPTVKHLAFNNCSTSASVISSLLVQLPSIETLSVNGGHMDRFLSGLAATEDRDVAHHYKNLRKLALFDIERRAVGIIAAIVFVRCFAPIREEEGSQEGDEDEERMDVDTTVGGAVAVNNARDPARPKRLEVLTIDSRTKNGIRSTPGRLDWLKERLTLESAQFPEVWPPMSMVDVVGSQDRSEGDDGEGGCSSGDDDAGVGQYPYLHPLERATWDSVWMVI
ncbi:hypothetical protein CVT24_005205 [Panaeolus cyanescens]|uniref:F-box domain-containing protein n=1 Tax=Panaeolus cyanescens TaxID=181874 RepID=A0A409Y968_9AGAR|nr:hypothetical protein CVT24_005205 [Panaeolus cyanescens]